MDQVVNFYLAPNKEKLMKFLTLLLTLAFSLSLTACNTVEGVGKDVEAAGDAIEDSADENKNY
jgi:entericidin B